MKFKRYSEIKERKMDLHLHTDWTDGVNTLEEMVSTAESLNLTHIAFTDHVRRSSSYFDDYATAINAMREKTRLSIYIGFEAKIDDFLGNIDVSDYISDIAEVKIASVHRYPIAGELLNADSFQMSEAQDIEKDLSIKAIEGNDRKHFNVLGHPGGMSISKFGEFPMDYFNILIKLCAEYDIAFEVNYRYHQKYIEKLDALLRRYNPYVTFGSDAHKQEDMKIRKR